MVSEPIWLLCLHSQFVLWYFANILTATTAHFLGDWYLPVWAAHRLMQTNSYFKCLQLDSFDTKVACKSDSLFHVWPKTYMKLIWCLVLFEFLQVNVLLLSITGAHIETFRPQHIPLVNSEWTVDPILHVLRLQGKLDYYRKTHAQRREHGNSIQKLSQGSEPMISLL